jgi:orotidine-5'-phosphate decarboxylase
MPADFLERTDRSLAKVGSLLCVGLDPDPSLMPRSLRGSSRARGMRRFLDTIVEATLPLAGAFKMQLAAYLNYGADGVDVLSEVVRTVAGRRITILDMKANDFPNTMRLYHDAAFGRFGFDAATVSPWMGKDSLEPFVSDRTHGVFLVAHSSNPGSRDLQDPPRSRSPPWVDVVRWARRLQRTNGNTGVVIGATYPGAVARARRLLGPSGLMLLPGIGAQGGALEASVRAGVGRHGRGLLVAASRSILYASRGSNWSEAAAAEAARLVDGINAARR